ncbi:hypothetical protein [Brevibacillus porteri]|uniref:hypothetical protein n=1 Tax=Brevibacillus porteri TaxID=2126350 RepID=UPI0036263646
MMNTYAIGVCKQEISAVIEPFIGIGFTKEYKINVGEQASLVTSDFYDNDAPVYFYIRHKKIEMSKDDVSKYFDITWKHGCYNTCIRNDIPCTNLTRVQEGATNLTERNTWTCQIGWEIGRGTCYRYKSE